jgi:hypothetical protein
MNEIRPKSPQIGQPADRNMPIRKQSFAARNKNSGKLVYFKDRQAMQNAIKQGTHEDPGAKNDKTSKGVPTKPANTTKPNAADFQTSAEKDKAASTKTDKGGAAPEKSGIPKLKDLIPHMDHSKKTLDQVDPLERQRVATIIDKLAELGNQAKEKGEKAPNFNLCQVTIPGTNLYCDGNKGIERAEMPQFKGTPAPGTPGSRLPKDKNGEVDTEKFFAKMLENKGIKVSEPVSVNPDKLKATQSELVGVKVAQMAKVLDDPNHPAYKVITDPIYVSNDGYVLDGHHRWAAVVAHNAAHPENQIPMKIRVVNAPIVPLVHQANQFAERMGIKAKAADTSVKESIHKLMSLLSSNVITLKESPISQFSGKPYNSDVQLRTQQDVIKALTKASHGMKWVYDYNKNIFVTQGHQINNIELKLGVPLKNNGYWVLFVYANGEYNILIKTKQFEQLLKTVNNLNALASFKIK